MLRKMSPLPILILLFLAAACSKDSDNTILPPNPPGGDSASGTITPMGGTLSVDLPGDITYTLEFPAGAVRDPLEVSLLPAKPLGVALFGVTFEPAGQVFAKPIAITIEFPLETELTDQHLAFGDPDDVFILATAVDHDNAILTGSMNYFGLTDVMVADQTKSAHGANQMGTAPASCSQLVGTLKIRFDAYLARDDFKKAVIIAEAIADTLLGSGCPDWLDWVEVLKQTACDGAQAAIDEAQATPISNYGDFFDQTSVLLDWQNILQELPTPLPCDLNFLDVIDEQLIASSYFATPIINSLQAFDYATIQDLRFEARKLVDLIFRAQILGLSNSEEALTVNGLYPAMNKMREIAFKLGRDSGWHYPLSRVTTQGFFAPRDIIGVTPQFSQTSPSDYFAFSNSNIYDDLQYCGTNVLLQALATSGGSIADERVGRGAGPGYYFNQVRMEAPTRGKLRLYGTLKAFSCWDDVESDEAIVFRMNGREVFALPRIPASSDYLQGLNAAFDIQTLTARAGIVPKEGFSDEIIAYRIGSNCNEDVWGPSEYPLFSWTVVWQNPTLEVAVGVPPSAEPGETVDVAVRVKVIDQLDQAGFYDAIDVVLQSSGGILQQVSGTTDSDGYFRTRVTVDDPLLIVNGKTGMAQLGMSIDATATSVEGATSQGTGLVVVGEAGQMNAVTRLSSASATAHAGGVRDYNWVGEEVDYPFTDFLGNVSASDESVDDDGQARSASATANCQVQFDFQNEPGMIGLSGSGSTSSSVSGGGSAKGVAKAIVYMEIVGAPVAYTFSGSVGADFAWAKLDKFESDGGGWEYPSIFDSSPGGFTNSGVLGIGKYRIKMDAVANNGDGAGAFSFEFKLNPPTPWQ